MLAWLGSFLVAAAQAEEDGALRVLEARCVECHDRSQQKGGLDLSSREGLLRGGETGAALVPGQPEKSLLWQLAARQRKPYMPHKRDPLTEEERAALAEWIKAGAPYPRTLKAPVKAAKKEFAITEADRKHWAWQALGRPEPPPGSARHPVDRFVQAKLAAAGLKPAPPASREILLRRVTYDLTGLPPSPEEIEAFAGDTSADAWEKVIDRLLASPHYGERWGRHWLDLARFAESNGFEHDLVWVHAWRYRDYVIRSLNEDKPYDRFVREQVAGDEIWPDEPDAVTATGFTLLGPDMDDSSDQIQRRVNTLSDMTDATAAVFLGLTLGCARCHDHKFEPFSQRDYYRLTAFYAPAAFRREAPVPTAAQRERYEKELAIYRAQPQVKELAELEGGARRKVREKKIAALSAEAMEAHRTPPEKRTTEQANLALETEPMLEVSEKELSGALTAEERSRRRSLQEEVKKLPQAPVLPMAMALGPGKPVKTHVLYRGEHTHPLDEVRPGFPEVLGGGEAGPARAALAHWLVGHPLTARVMVNRVWRQYFGRGLVPTPSEFGPHGQSPTHPELLDWLAGEFAARRWSLKELHRLILTSGTYRQSSAATHGAKKDPENLLLWRMNRRRLEGEAIRDSLLAISGRLNLAMGGPGVLPPMPPDVPKGPRGWNASPDPKDHVRRSVYIFARRNIRYPFLEVFDAPDSNLSCPERGRSTTAPQALTLLNAGEVVAAARATAERLEREAPGLEARIDRAFRLIVGRGPTEREAALAREFLAGSPLSEFCRALFNLNAFIYLE